MFAMCWSQRDYKFSILLAALVSVSPKKVLEWDSHEQTNRLCEGSGTSNRC